ncbi:hypothetical protein Tco_0394783 [Tanacetum coccineum]
MSSITAQQTKLDLELVPKENRIDIRKCNGRIPRGLTLKEPTFQVILDAIALTPCYPAFLITADVPENSVILGRSIHSIEEEILSFLRDLGPTGDITSLNYVVVNQMHQPWRTFAAVINKSLSGKTSGLDKLLFLSKQMKNLSRKENELRDLPINLQLLQLQVALAEKSQLKEITPTVTSEGTGDKPGVPDVTEDDSTESESESWGNDEDDSNNEQEASDEGSGQENESEEQESDSEQDEESDDDNQEEEEVDQENESEDDEIESDEDKGMDDTTDQFDDDVDARLEEPTQTGKEIVQGKGADVEMDEAQQGNENLETTQEQVVDDAHVTITTVTKKTEVPVTSSSRSSDLASKFLNFSDIPQTDAEIVSPLDVHVHHEVPRTQAPTLLTIPVSVITESSPVFTNIPQSSQTFTPPPILTTPTPPPTIETTNPLSTLPDFASVFRFNDRITTLEKEVAEIKKDPLHTQVTSLVDEHLDTRLGETREEFMNFLSESLTARIKEQVKDQLPQILPKEVSNFAPPVIEKLIKESRDEVTLAKVSSQPQSTYEAASTLTEFELKKILLDKMEKSESYLTAPEHRDCYDGLKKSYALDKDFFFSYDVYSLKRGRKDKDKDEDPSAGSNRGLKKRKLSKDAEPTIEPKKKDSTSGSSKGTKSQPRSSGKSVQSEEPVFEVADLDMPHDQEGNMGDNEDEPRKETASRRDWFKKPTQPQEPTDPDWNISKTTQEGPTQNWLMTLAASTSTDKSLKDFDELMSTLIDFSGYILNGLKIENLTQEILLGPAFRLLKDRRAAKYDIPSIEAWFQHWCLLKLLMTSYELWWSLMSWFMRKPRYGLLEEIVVRRADNVLYRFKEGDFLRLQINDIKDMLILVRRVEDLQLGVKSYQKKINVTKPDTTRPDLKKRHPYTPYKDPQGFIYVDDYKRNRLMRFDELYKFSDDTLTRLLSSLEDITKNIDMQTCLRDDGANLDKKKRHS